MKNEKEIVEALRVQGFVTTEEAATLIGRESGGNISDLLIKGKVRSIAVGDEQTGRVRKMWLKTDLKNVPMKLQKVEAQLPFPVAGESNGGKIMHRLKEIEARLKTLEEFRQSFYS